jgi:integrase
MKTWDARQVASVLKAAASDEWEALWRLALLTGMRRGELLGLRWADVDLDAGALAVRRTLSRGATSRLGAGEPKTVGRFRQLIDRAGVPAIRFHDLRHTCATLLLAEGVHPKVVQERLGHANIAETLDRHSHGAADMQRHAADRLVEAIDAANGDAEQTA